MKNLLFILSLTLLLNNAFAQPEIPQEKRLADTMQALYNKGKYKEIFALFSPEMKKALPPGKTKEFFAGLHNQMGRILTKEFTGRKDAYALYKAKFENGVMEISLAVYNSEITGLYIQLLNPPAADSMPVMERNITPLILPFESEWTVVWGGDTRELNHHGDHRHQKNAFDIVITDDRGQSYKTDGKRNEDYYVFGQRILAPCEGEIIEVIDGVRDNKPGKFNKVDIAGNMVLLRAPAGEYLFFAHLKNGTVDVKKGDKVGKGQLLGLCGNSGNSSEPHLHFHIQTVDKDGPIGVKCYFEKLLVNGELKTGYSPIRWDKIRNAE